MDKKKLYVIDGNSLLFRAFYATYMGDPSAIMRSNDGTPTNAIFAFANMLLKILSSFEGGEYLFVGFDSDSQTFRKKEFASYKANRKPAPPELIPQFALSRDLLKSLGIKYYEESGIEADDICGTIAKKASKSGEYQVEVFTSDKDYLQLIDPNIKVNLLKTGLSNIIPMDETKMQEEWGFGPLQIIDYKGLCGDSSDNLPGIPGIGDKTAKKLIAEHGDFPSIIEAAKQGLIKGKLGEKILSGEASGEESYKLAHILIDCPLPFGLDDCLYKGYNPNLALAFAERYGLRQLSSRLPKRLAQGADEQKKEYVDDPNIDFAKPYCFYLDCEEDGYPHSSPKGIAVVSGNNYHYFRLIELEANEALKASLANPDIRKSGCNVKQAYCTLSHLGIELKGVAYDSLLAAYVLDSNGAANPIEALASLGETITGENEEKAIRIAIATSETEQKALTALSSSSQAKLFEEVELPLTFVLARMELEGIAVNKEELLSIGKTYIAKRDAAEQEVIHLAGHPFNVASSKQVAAVLFDELGLPSGKKRSTSIEELKALQASHPIVSKILEYRKYAKLVGTYIEGLSYHIHDGKIHTTFNQTLTSTGRLSSSSPNLQNVSTRDEESALIKKAFHYDDGRKILSLDYSQIELRILSSLANCEPYKQVFALGHDVHSETARRIFHLKPGEEVSKDMRRKAKAVNFAIIYGTSAYGLSEQIGCTPREASNLIAEFYRHYPEIDQYLRSIIETVERQGYVSTILNRRRYLPDITSSNYATRDAAKRAALNAPVQGSAADLIKVAMIKVDQFLKDNHCKSKLILQIHDELLFALAPSEEATLPEQIKQIMVTALPFDVKLEAEVGIGDNWLEAK